MQIRKGMSEDSGEQCYALVSEFHLLYWAPFVMTVILVSSGWLVIYYHRVSAWYRLIEGN